jgi:hypothetical protein
MRYTWDVEIEYLIACAERCYRLARDATDQGLADQLINLGKEFADHALALGADPNSLPQPPGGAVSRE